MAGWGWESTAAALGMDRKHSLCVSTARYRGPPEAGGWLLRLRSHLITSDPCRSTHNAPLTEHTSAQYRCSTHTHTHTHTHTQACFRQFISMQISICPLSWEEGLADCIFSPLSYGVSRLYSELSGRTKQPRVHTASACLNWFVEFYVKHQAFFLSRLFFICSLLMQEDALMLIVNNVYLHFLKCRAV